MKIIGLTGGIGTGKSTISRYLKDKGYEIIDADQLARSIVEPGEPALLQLVEYFGEGILSSDGTLCRRRLAEEAFASSAGKEALDRITHGAVIQKIDRLCEDFAAREGRGEALLFIDAPLLLETGLASRVSRIWVVDVPDELRMQRIRLRDGLSDEEIRARIRCQMSREEKLARADDVLDNSGSLQQLYAQVDQLLSGLKGDGR